MEVNKDEAERCVDIATAALNSHQLEKAIKFLEKAQRLFPTEKAKGKKNIKCRGRRKPLQLQHHAPASYKEAAHPAACSFTASWLTYNITKT